MRYLATILLLCLLVPLSWGAIDQTDTLSTINSPIATFSFTNTEKTWQFLWTAGAKSTGRVISFRSLSGDWEWARATGGPYNPVYANEQFNWQIQSDSDIVYLRGLGGAGSGTIRAWVSK